MSELLRKESNIVNPVFVFLVIAGAGLLWVLLSGLFRLIGSVTNHVIKKTEKALKDEPGNAEMFAKGFVHGFKKNKPHDNSE